MNNFSLVSFYALGIESLFNVTNVLMCLVDADTQRKETISNGDNVLLMVKCEMTPANLESIFNLGVSFSVVDNMYRFYINRLALFGADK